MYDSQNRTTLDVVVLLFSLYVELHTFSTLIVVQEYKLNNMYQNNVTREPESYIDSEKFGFFSIFKKQNDEVSQRSYLNKYLADVLPEEIAKANRDGDNIFISQATFHNRNRQRSSFLSCSALFVDLDIYSPKNTFDCGGMYTQEHYIQIVYMICEEYAIPKPSIIINSGGGLYLKWLLRSPVFERGLNYWEVIQQKLNSLFSRFGADVNAMDVSRVLRCVGSHNQKYDDKPLCEVMAVDYKSGSHSELNEYDFLDFQPLLDWTLDEVRAFKEQASQSFLPVQKVAAEKKRRLMILDALKEHQECNRLDGLTAKQLNTYIIQTNSLKRFNEKECAHYLKLFMKRVYRSEATGAPITTAQRNNLIRRNWGLYRDLHDLATHRYGNAGVEDGLRDLFLYITCNQYALSEWRRKTLNELKAHFQTVASMLVPQWSQKRIDNALSYVIKRAEISQATGEVRLYKFSDDYIHAKLNVTQDELRLVDDKGNYIIREALGETERERRDPLRANKKRIKNAKRVVKHSRYKGSVSMQEYREKHTNQSLEKRKKALELKALGWKNAQIAFEIGVHIKSVSRYLK
ncbi:TPA: hypothetical protein ACX6Q0_003815 [Photobacterium damselae]